MSAEYLRVAEQSLRNPISGVYSLYGGHDRTLLKILPVNS